MKCGVPELSLADYLLGSPSARAAFSKALMLGLQRYGFIILRDHLIASASIDEAYGLSAQFFAQTEEVKRRYVAGPRGYAPFRTEHAKNQTVPDLKEFWQIGPEHSDNRPGRCEAGPPNIWPQYPAGFKEAFLALFDALQETGRVILEALTPALGKPTDFFEPLIRGRNSVLRLLHYPPVAGDGRHPLRRP